MKLLVTGGEPQKAIFLNSGTFKHQCNELQYNEIVDVMDCFTFCNCQARIVGPGAMTLFGILKSVIHFFDVALTPFRLWNLQQHTTIELHCNEVTSDAKIAS